MTTGRSRGPDLLMLISPEPTELSAGADVVLIWVMGLGDMMAFDHCCHKEAPTDPGGKSTTSGHCILLL